MGGTQQLVVLWVDLAPETSFEAVASDLFCLAPLVLEIDLHDHLARFVRLVLHRVRTILIVDYSVV